MQRADLRNVAVLDYSSADGRRLIETVRGAGFVPVEVGTRGQLEELFKDQKAVVGVVAFEALGAEPQRALRELKEAVPSARLIAVYSTEARRRLLERLWLAGLLDAVVARSTPPHEVNLLLRQAYADALLDAAGSEDDGSSPRIDARLRLLRNLGAAFTSQRRIEGLTRELASRLPALADFQVLALMVVDEQPRIYVQQTSAVEHDVLWTLAEEISVTSAPYADAPFGPDDLTFMDSGLVETLSGNEPVTAPLHDRTVCVPMVVFGRLVGCLGLVLTAPPQGEVRTLLQLISYQLSTAIQNLRSLEQAEAAALVDELTGAYNRRYLSRVLDSEWRRARRYKLHLAAAMVDIDHFKRLNDLHGHLVGDAVLRALVSLLRETLRDTDHIIRYGGEEFLLLLPETGVKEAALVVERMRMMVGRQAIHVGDAIGKLQISFSAGVAAFPATSVQSAEELVRKADEALLAAKRAGRDRVIIAAENAAQLEAGEGAAGGAGDREESDPEKRRFPRIDSQLRVRYLELPEIDSRIVGMESADLSAGGLKLQGPSSTLKRDSYALVFLEDDQKPLLSRVVWTKDGEAGERSAGLEFVRPADLAHQTNELPAIATRALVIVDRSDTRGLVERVLIAARYEVTYLHPDNEDDVDALDLTAYSLLIVGESSMRGAFGKRLARVRGAKGSGLRIVVINESNSRREVIEAIGKDQAEALVSHDSSSEEALFATLTKLLLGEYFGIKKYLMWGAPTRSWMMTADSDKQRVLDGIGQVAKGVHCHPRLIDLLISAVDEMIINAIYQPAAKKPGNAHRPITVECGSDGRLFAVGVRDEFGHFEQADMFKDIGQALEGEGWAEQKPSHATLGFQIMLNTLSQLAVNVDPGRCTEIIGIVDLRKSLREIRSSAPSVGVFRKEPQLPALPESRRKR